MTAGARFASSLRRLDEDGDSEVRSRVISKGEEWARGWGEGRVEGTKQSRQTARRDR